MNKPEPCVLGKIPTSESNGRISSGLRPSGLIFSSAIKRLTSSLIKSFKIEYTSLINNSFSGSSSSTNSLTISSFKLSRLSSRCCLSNVNTVSLSPFLQLMTSLVLLKLHHVLQE